MNWLNRLFRPESDTPQYSEHDLHRAAAALLFEVARTDGTVDQAETQRLIAAVEQHWHLDAEEMRVRIRLIAAAALGPAPRNTPVPEFTNGLPMDHISYLVRFACAALGDHDSATSATPSG